MTLDKILLNDELQQKIIKSGHDWAESQGFWFGGIYGFLAPAILYLDGIVKNSTGVPSSSSEIAGGAIMFTYCGIVLSLPICALAGRIVSPFVGAFYANIFLSLYKLWDTHWQSVIRFPTLALIGSVLLPIVEIIGLVSLYFILNQNVLFSLFALGPTILIAPATPFGAQHVLRLYQNELKGIAHA